MSLAVHPQPVTILTLLSWLRAIKSVISLVLKKVTSSVYEPSFVLQKVQIKYYNFLFMCSCLAR
jgi:hypothetical protein